MMTLEEYMRELILMEKQYGQEEELYPLINMLLRENDNVKHLSVRDVHKSGSTGMRKRMLYGYASFPDLVILDEECDLSFEDLKDWNTNHNYKIKYNMIKTKMGDKEIKDEKCISQKFKEYEKGSDKEKQSKDLTLSDEEKKLINHLWSEAIFNENGNNAIIEVEKQLDFMYGCIEAKVKKPKVKKSKDPIIEAVANIPDIKTGVFSLSVDKKNFYFCYKNNTDIKLPCGQFVGELLLYGKALYVDETIWKYFEISQSAKKEFREKLLESCILKGGDWVYCIEPKAEFECMCVELGNLSNAYEELVKKPEGDKLGKLKKRLYLRDNETYKWEKEWSRLKYNLAYINWIGENTYDQFITKKDYEEYEKTKKPTP